MYRAIAKSAEQNRMNTLKSLIVAGIAALCVAVASADEAPQSIALKDHKFTPAVIHVKANEVSLLSLANNDDTAEEFDSTSLKVEKVVAGHSSGHIRLRPLSPGRYPFMGEFHSETAQGVVIAE